MRKPSETIAGLPVLAPNELSTWLGVLFESYRTPLTENAAAGYTLALADLTARELEVAFSESLRRHRSNFPPTPAQIRGYLEAAAERMPARPQRQATVDCRICGGTGYETVEREGRRLAVLCRCTKHPAA